MNKFRYTIRLIVAYLSRFKGIIFIGVVFGIGTFFIFRLLIHLIVIPKRTIGMTGRYHAEELPLQILEIISSGLTKINEEGIVEPDIAYSWETPDKGKTWIFNIREDVFWQDGTNVKSSEISYEFSDVEVEIPDEKTIIFKLKNPFSPFPSVVSKPVFKKGLMGTGEWEVEKIIFSGNYVQELIIVKDKNKTTYKFYPTSSRTKIAYKLGEIDEIVNILDPSPFDSWNNVETESFSNKNQVVTLFFNNQNALFSDKSFRQALTYAIDKKSLGERSISPIFPESWAFNPQVKKYDFNVEKSKELLEDLPDSFKSQQIKLTSSPALLDTAEKISEYWKNIGIDSVVLVSSILPEEFEIFLSIYDIPMDPDQYAMWHSTQTSTNITNLSSARIDKFLEDGRIELTLEKRKKIYIDFQRFLLEELPASFLYHPTYYNIRRK